jgi:hypothetical protein
MLAVTPSAPIEMLDTEPGNEVILWNKGHETRHDTPERLDPPQPEF